MKHLYSLLLATVLFLSASVINSTRAQCGGAYPNAAQVNWDNLDYFYNSGSNIAPYGFSTPSSGNYVSNAMEQTQRFALGTTAVRIATSAAGIVRGENGTHTGDLAGYTGQDAAFQFTATGQTIIMTFASPVSAPNFTIYDIDRSQQLTITATNNLGVATTVNVTLQAGTIITVGGTPTARTLTATSASLATNVNTGAATITVPGAVNSITITVNTLGSDAAIWLSDINACTSGSFTTDWHKMTTNQPFLGPTQNMPDYFLVTPDNNTVYYADPASGRTRALFTDAAKTYVNSFGYDPANQYLYYISENSSVDYTNRAIKRWDLATETSTTWVANVNSAPLNIPTFNSGVESAGCAFYDGELYFGIEGGTHSTGGGSPTITTRETIIWRIEMDASNNPIGAVQVFATDASTSGSGTQTSVHDWGDFIIKNGIIYDFNTARNGCGGSCMNYSQSKYHHYNMMSGQVTNVYNNPGTTIWNGQSGMTWQGALYYFRPQTSGTVCEVGVYNEAGGNGSPVSLTVVGGGPAWPGGTGDASDPFRPKCDFGDAPLTYDPVVNSPAVHERADTMWFGTTNVESANWSKEYLKRGVNGTADTDNGIGTVPFLRPSVTQTYVTQVSLYNNSTGNARIMAWLDYNGNGVFDASEAATISPAGDIAPGTSIQTRYIYWTGISTPLPLGSVTYLRIRITSAAAGMTGSHATGYFEKGEVEDYRVIVDNYPLASTIVDFNAILKEQHVQADWKINEDGSVYSYELERSADQLNWTKVATVEARRATGTFQYQATDEHPLKGTSYYRVRLVEATGLSRTTAIRPINYNSFEVTLDVTPNPARDQAKIKVNINEESEAVLQLFNIQGKEVWSQKRLLPAGSNTVELPVPASLGSGLYSLRLTAGGKTLQQKLVINH